MNFAKIVKTPFLQNISGRLLLRKYSENEILRNRAIQIDSSVSLFNEFFLIFIIFRNNFVLVNRFIFGNSFAVDQQIYIWK